MPRKMQFCSVSLLRKVAKSTTQKVICPCSLSSSLKLWRTDYFTPRLYSSDPQLEQEFALKKMSTTLGLKDKLLLKLGLKKARTEILTYLTYGYTVDKSINYAAFYKDLKLADTMFSWFLITELHIWMIMVRYMAIQPDGIHYRDALCNAMWADVVQRIDKLGTIKRKIKNKQMSELGGQFNATLIAYDEGILTDDKQLADALWRRILHGEGNDPLVLEKLVIFVRQQLELLDSIPTDDVLTVPRLKWIDYATIKPY